MSQVLTSVLVGVGVGIVSLVVGWAFSRHQTRELVKAAIRTLRPFVPISLRDEFYMTHILASRIRDQSFRPDLIVAIAPGGSMIGEWLSRRFLGDKTRPVPMCSLWMDVERDVEGRHVSSPAASTFVSSPSPEAKRVLIVNDISRSGRTIGEAIESVNAAFQSSVVKTAVLFLSQDSGPREPDFWVDRPSYRVTFEWKEWGT